MCWWFDRGGHREVKEPGSMLVNSQLVGKWGGDNLSYVLHATLGIQIQSEIKEIQIQHIV